MKVASITGITGQDGSYLAELLLKKATKFTALSIAELAELISNVVSFQSKLKFDSSELDGTPRKLIIERSLQAKHEKNPARGVVRIYRREY